MPTTLVPRRRSRAPVWPDAPALFIVPGLSVDPGTLPAVRFSGFRLPDGRIVRRKDGRGIVFYPREKASLAGYVVASDAEFGVDVWAQSDSELVEVLEEALAVNWREFAEADSATLSREARALKKRLLAAFEVVPDA